MERRREEEELGRRRVAGLEEDGDECLAIALEERREEEDELSRGGLEGREIKLDALIGNYKQK